MACRVCPTCPTRWPVRQCYFNCPRCGRQTSWSSAHATATPDEERLAAAVSGQIAELAADIAHLENLSGQSTRALSFRHALSEHWPTASDVPGPFIRGGAGGEARPT